MVLVAPSILSADFSRLGEEIVAVDAAGADWIHLDVMDGNFVPNLTFGAPVIKKIRSLTKKIFDTHLMVIEPERLLQDFIQAGSDSITIHVESTHNISQIITQIHDAGKKVGLSINPETSINVLEPYLEKMDLILIMSVKPGFGGQKFMPEVLSKVHQLKQWKESNSNHHYLIQIDGGINETTISQAKNAGVDVVVAGSYIFNHSNYQKAITYLKNS